MVESARMKGYLDMVFTRPVYPINLFVCDVQNVRINRKGINETDGRKKVDQLFFGPSHP